MKGNRCIENLNGYQDEIMPIYECPCERIVNREFNHEVRHIMPVHTRIINNHIYHHSCTPCFTCSEENKICNVYDDCCKF